MISNQATSQLIKSIANEIGLRIELRFDNKEKWDVILDKCHYVPNAYTHSSIDYQLAYQTGHGGEWNDLSFIIYWGDNLAGVCPITLSNKDSAASVSSQGQYLHPPIFDKNLTISAKRELTELAIDLVYKLSQYLGVLSFKSADSFINDISISEWHMGARTKGATCEVQHELYLKISDSIEEIQKNFRRTLRDRIKQGLKLWKCNTLKSNSENIDSIWGEFQSLHLQASGKKTRSEASWLIQKQLIQNDKAFLVYLRDDAGLMIGGGYFTFSRDEGTYAVAAYDRSLFKKPVGHLVQFEAIKEFIERKIPWYNIGYYPDPLDNPMPTEKELSIGHFKKQFSSHTFPRFKFFHLVNGS